METNDLINDGNLEWTKTTMREDCVGEDYQKENRITKCWVKNRKKAAKKKI